jgi:hypothetical protein
MNLALLAAWRFVLCQLHLFSDAALAVESLVDHRTCCSRVVRCYLAAERGRCDQSSDVDLDLDVDVDVDGNGDVDLDDPR